MPQEDWTISHERTLWFCENSRSKKKKKVGVQTILITYFKWNSRSHRKIFFW